AHARGNDVLAERLGNSLLGSLTGSAGMKLDGGEETNERMRAALNGEGGKLAELNALVQNPAQNEMGRAIDFYGQRETRLFELASQMEEMDQRHLASRALVEQFQGREIDPDHPQGLALSRTLLRAVQLAEQCDGNLGALTDREREEYLELARALRGFNPDTLEVPFFQFDKLPATVQQIRAWGQQQALTNTAEAIVFLRQTRPDDQREIETMVREMDVIVDYRLELMGDSSVALRDTIRAAILHALTTTGSKVEGFRPSEHAHTIKSTLRDWGVPVDHVLPEINRM